MPFSNQFASFLDRQGFRPQRDKSASNETDTTEAGDSADSAFGLAGDCGEDRFFIITGGPGSGKSAIISALANRGFPVMTEAGRAVILEQSESGGQALPWADRPAFAELMLSRELNSYKEAGNFDGPVFFDRGIPDVAGYLKVCGLAIPDHILAAAATCRYAKRVFFAPPWPEIYHQDSERKQSWDEAVATAIEMVKTYSALGYEIHHLPFGPIRERADHIISWIIR